MRKHGFEGDNWDRLIQKINNDNKVSKNPEKGVNEVPVTLESDRREDIEAIYLIDTWIKSSVEKGKEKTLANFVEMAKSQPYYIQTIVFRLNYILMGLKETLTFGSTEENNKVSLDQFKVLQEVYTDFLKMYPQSLDKIK